MPAGDPLQEYRRKRVFDRTGEPAGDAPGSPAQRTDGEADPLFVIQKHAASRLHYDFRLEAGGVLKSWAVPKGPSLNPRDKRLAMATEDHPLDYARFEGTIAKGQYGAGTVIVWDIGTYRNIHEVGGRPVPMEACLAAGRVEIRLEGRKLRGGYALVRTAMPGGESWLLIKMKDAEARSEGDVLQDLPRSALSGRTLEEEAGTSGSGG